MNDQTVESYFDQIHSYPLLTIEEEIELSKKILEGDESAVDELVKHNLRFVVSLAHEYSDRYKLPFIELISEGNVGLIRAAQKYDYRKGAKFSSYAAHWIKQAIRSVLWNYKFSPLRIPSSSLRKIKLAERIENELKDTGNKYPSPKEISEKCELSEKEIRNALNRNYEIVHLDKTIEESNDTLHYLVYDEAVDTSDKELAKFILNDIMPKILTKQELDIVKRRYGFGENEQGETLHTISKSYSITRERIRQIQLTALRKLRKYFEDHQNKT